MLNSFPDLFFELTDNLGLNGVFKLVFEEPDVFTPRSWGRFDGMPGHFVFDCNISLKDLYNCLEELKK